MSISLRIAELKKEIEGFRDNLDVYADFDELLDEGGAVEVCGVWFNPSDILKELDPTAYRCGYLDYTGALDLESFSEYNEILDELEELEFVTIKGL